MSAASYPAPDMGLFVLALGGVVLVFVDAAGFLILLAGQEFLVGLGEVTVILGAHAALFLVNAGFLVLESLCRLQYANSMKRRAFAPRDRFVSLVRSSSWAARW